ncbi:MAG: hypothetical protein ACO3O0_00200 [Bacteroidia bacterium]
MMQQLQRNELIDLIVSNSKRIQCIILNPCGAPSKLQVDLSTIDLLVDKKGEEDFLVFCRSNKNVKEVLVYPRFGRKKVSVKMTDGSEVSLKLIRQMVRKTLCTLPVDQIFDSCEENMFGMLVPSVEHQFEYIMMKSHFSKSEFPDKYQKYFSSMDPAVRSKVFRYLQLKYNFVFNVIEDLYRPKNSVMLKITTGLRALPENSLGRIFFRSLKLIVWNVGIVFQKKSIRLGPIHRDKSSESSSKSSVNFV